MTEGAKGVDRSPVESPAVKILLVSDDPATRDSTAVAMRSVERTAGEAVEFLRAKDGLDGVKLAWRHLPEVVVTDEISSRAGAFALTRDLKGAARVFPGAVVILLDRPQDAWLAEWSGADAWFVKPVNPFELADAVSRSMARRQEEAV
jgi:DNA-binding NarL/FixJ family response regulator